LRFLAISLAIYVVILYNEQCWSLKAMMRKVVGTPGPFAMGKVAKKFPRRMSIIKMGEKEGK